MARRRRTSTFEDMVELASRLPWWLALILALASYLLLHTYATTPLPPVADPRQMGQHLTSSVFRGLAMAGQYLLPLAFVFGAIVSVFSRLRRRKLLSNVASATKPGQIIAGVSWSEFELLVGEIFRNKGYSVSERGGAGSDGGIDLVLHKDGEKYLVQCKHWRSMKVGVPVLRDFLGAMAIEGAAGGFVVTSGSFTYEAKEFVDGLNIQLVDGAEVDVWVRSSPFLARRDVATSSANSEVKKACPICSSPMIQRKARRGKSAGALFWGCSRYPSCRGTIN